MKGTVLRCLHLFVLLFLANTLDGQEYYGGETVEYQPCSTCGGNGMASSTVIAHTSASTTTPSGREEQSGSVYASSTGPVSASSHSSVVTKSKRSKKKKSSPSPPTPTHPSPSPKVVHLPPRERNLTERMRDAILAADVNEVERLINENDAITELGLGFTFPAERRDKYLFESEFRFTDPDVVSLKGMAQAAISGREPCKLTEIFIDAIYGLDFDTNICPEPSPSPKPRRGCKKKISKTVITTHGKTETTITETTFTPYSSPRIREFSEDEHWDFDFDCEQQPEPEPQPSPASPAPSRTTVPECFTREEIATVRRNLQEDFADLELMMGIVTGDPREPFRRRRSRSLLVVGTPVNAWPCGSCWRPRFCNKNVYWCPQ